MQLKVAKTTLLKMTLIMTTLFKMTLLITTLFKMTMLITLNMGDITSNEIPYNINKCNIAHMFFF